jgi:hypothetical protein
MRKASIRNMLSVEERAEYDATVFEAGFDRAGKRRPSHEIGEHFHALLLDAIQAKRPWAQWVMDEDARAGHIRRFKAWDRTRQPVHTKDGERIVRVSRVQAVRRRDPETEAMFWQDTEYEDMGVADLDSVIAGMDGKIAPLLHNRETARSLRDLVEQTGAATVREALKRRGMSMDNYLLGRAA